MTDPVGLKFSVEGVGFSLFEVESEIADRQVYVMAEGGLTHEWLPLWLDAAGARQLAACLLQCAEEIESLPAAP